jgi:Sodium/hydrogen exchanger family
VCCGSGDWGRRRCGGGGGCGWSAVSSAAVLTAAVRYPFAHAAALPCVCALCDCDSPALPWRERSFLASCQPLTPRYLALATAHTTRALCRRQRACRSAWAYVVVIYLGVHLARVAVVAICSPVLIADGTRRGVDLRQAAVLAFGGLRGAIGLTLALILYRDETVSVVTRVCRVRAVRWRSFSAATRT